MPLLVAEHALDGEMGLAGIGRPEDRDEPRSGAEHGHARRYRARRRQGKCKPIKRPSTPWLRLLATRRRSRIGAKLWILRWRGLRHISSARSGTIATAAMTQETQKLPGGSQPPARNRRALALQREGDLPARADLQRLGRLRPAALCGADRAGAGRGRHRLPRRADPRQDRAHPDRSPITASA